MTSRGQISLLANKAEALLALLSQRPREVHDRVATFCNVRWEGWYRQPGVYIPQEWRTVLNGLGKALGRQLETILTEPACVQLMEEIRAGVHQRLVHAPFSLAHNADFTLAQLCYAACRVTQPAVVLETGVAYGVTSAFILKALEVNGKGLLYSIDLPPLRTDADRFVGALIPQALKHRWRLHRGVSKRVLPHLLPQLRRVDVFVHDSLHTYTNIRRELQLVAPYLAPRSLVLADDIDGNTAFHEWVKDTRPDFWATMRETEKNSLLGLTVLHRKDCCQ